MKPIQIWLKVFASAAISKVTWLFFQMYAASRKIIVFTGGKPSTKWKKISDY